MSDDELAKQVLMGKDATFYQTFLAAWVTSRMEKDKHILTLSALAIGLLMTFRLEPDDIIAFRIWLSAGMSFVISILVILWIFSQNSDYIEQIIRDDDRVKKMRIEKSLKCSTILASILFGFGVILTVLLAAYRIEFIISQGT